MAIAASWLREPASWLRERYGLAFVAFAAFLASAVFGMRGSAIAFGRSAALAWIMVLVLRLLDDLASMEEDRRWQPHRIMARTHRPRLFWGFYGVAVAIVAVELGLGWLALNAALLAVYTLRTPLRAWIVLLKYPAIVALISGAGIGTSRAAAVLVAVTIAMAVNECLHDPRVLGRAATRRDHVLRHMIFGMEALLFWITSRA